MKSSKWKYYGCKETGAIWKQKKAYKGNPSIKYHLYILTRKEANKIAKNDNLKIVINSNTNKMAKKEKKEKKGKKEEKKKGSSKKAAPKTGSSDAQVVRKLDASLALSKLKHVMMTKKNKKGKKIECIVIPIKQNYLFKDEKSGAVYLGVSVNLKDGEDEYGQHGFIGQKIDGRIYKEASDSEKEEMKKTPILGGMKDWEFTDNSAARDTAGSQGEMEEDDDLPF